MTLIEDAVPSNRSSFRKHTIWRTALPDVKSAVLPASNNRPNPLVSGERLFASVFAPGAICSLHRASGKLIWRRELGEYAGASVYLHRGRLFAKSSHTLYALRPGSGEVLWSFCPYGTEGESIYSSPSGNQDRIYIGDRHGYLHSLDAKTGRTIWRRLVSKAKNNDVNSTPLITRQGLVVVTTNAQTAVAFDRESGTLVWKQKLEGPSVFGPLLHRGMLVAVSQSVQLLDPTTGRIEKHYYWRDNPVAFVETTPRRLAVSLRGTWPPEGNSEVILLTGSKVQRRIPLTGYCLQFRYSGHNRLFYLSHLNGLDLFDPSNGEIRCRLTIPGANDGTGLVDVRGNVIYALTGDGHVYALRHPENLEALSVATL